MCDDDNEPSADEIATTCRRARSAEKKAAERYHLRHLSLDDEDAQDKIGELSDHGAGVERMLDYLDRKDAARRRDNKIHVLKQKIFGKGTWGVNNGRNSGSVRDYNDAIKAIPSADRADFKANPRRWLKSHFEHSPKVFGALWAECRREYFDDLRRCFRFLGLDYVADREEVYPPIFPDEVLSEAEQEQVEVYIKHHVKVKRGGKR